MNVLHINPCRPFTGMSRLGDFEEMLVDALAFGFNLSGQYRMIVDEAIHHTFAAKQSEGTSVVMRDIVDKIWELRARFGDKIAFEVCALFNPMIDESYQEYGVFNEENGVAFNDLDVNGLKSVLINISNRCVRSFIEKMILYSLMF